MLYIEGKNIDSWDIGCKSHVVNGFDTILQTEADEFWETSANHKCVEVWQIKFID
jgi:hypothetical protein